MSGHVGFRVITDIRRPPDELLRDFEGLQSCDISDVMKRSCTMTGIRPVYTPVTRVVGTAVTVSVPAGGINMIKLGVEQTRPGDILVVSAQGAMEFALWGGNLTRGLRARGVRAFIIDGAVRDVTQMREIGLPVFARGVATAVGSVDAPWGEVNVPVACGGAVVRPGDIVVADEDGIVVVPPEHAREIAAGTHALMEQHESFQPTLLRGEVTNLARITEQMTSAGLVFLQEDGISALTGRET
jgi:4-hydroxy-4-methyl-2-oxoglutarate aldolase